MMTLSSTRVGSIPACAGEPYMRHRPRHASKVYPRVCGGTPKAPYHRVNAAGLSPRVRGNQSRELDGGYLDRSIPACAGEPRAIMI